MIEPTGSHRVIHESPRRALLGPHTLVAYDHPCRGSKA